MAKPASPPKLVAAPSYSAKEFFLEDVPRTFFPLSTNRVLVEKGEAEIRAHISRIADGSASFLPQRRVHANKDDLHLRRTVKLDPVAEFFIYDLVYRNRGLFKKPSYPIREHFGYRFEAGRPASASESYANFKSAVSLGSVLFGHFIGFDIASYFNGLYHHDLRAWFAARGAEEDDVEIFGKYLRQINAGRSLDCLPQGLYPTKMIGNDFLRFIEESSFLRSTQIVRFMDDVYLFDDNRDVVVSDFAEVQRLSGLKGLSVNASKTHSDGRPNTDMAEDGIDELKKRLLKRRRKIIITRYDDVIEGEVEEEFLDPEELDFVLELLNGPLSEEDAELILFVARKNIKDIEFYLEKFVGFPNLSKNFFALCQDAEDKDAVAQIVFDRAFRGGTSEYQLFWFGMMVERYLLDTKLAGDIIHRTLHASQRDGHLESEAARDSRRSIRSPGNERGISPRGPF